MLSRQLRYFLAVAEHESFTTAAAKIGVAQPALSTQVAKLEERLGCQLFLRHARGVSLTEAGRYLRQEARQIVEQISRTEREIKLRARAGPVECTIGLPPTVANLVAVPLVNAVSRVLPQVSLCILDAMGGALREWYADGRIDIALLYGVPGEPLADPHYLLSEEFNVAIARTSPFLSKEVFSFDDLLGLPLIVSTKRNAHRQNFEYLARQCGKPLRIAGEIDSVNGQRKLVLMGAGAAVLPMSDFCDWPTKELHLAPVKRADICASLLMVRGRRTGNVPEICAVQSILLQTVSDFVKDGTWPGAQLAEFAAHS